MVTKWHHQDDPIRPRDLLIALDVKNKELSGSIGHVGIIKKGNLKTDIYRDLIILLARTDLKLPEIADALGVPTRTLRHHLRKMFS